MTAYLKWVDPQGCEQMRELTADELVVGRRSDADIVLNNPSISRRHAKLTRGPQGYGLTDLQSTHGTFVNGRRIEQQQLRPGDRTCLGQDRTELLYANEEAGTAQLAVGSPVDELETSFLKSKFILPAEPGEHSDLEKISSILDFQYHWGQAFSSGKMFEQILQAALKVSGGERGFILLKQPDGELLLGLAGRRRANQWLPTGSK